MPSKNTYPPKVNISKTIKNLSELRSIINVIADKFGQYLSEIAKDYMQQYIEEEVYTNNVLASGTDGEDSYERTYEFLNSIVVRKVGNQWKVGADGRKISATPRVPSSGKFGQHASFDNSSVAGQMSSFIEYGNNSPAYSYSGIRYIEKTQHSIDSIVDVEWNKFKSINGIK